MDLPWLPRQMENAEIATWRIAGARTQMQHSIEVRNMVPQTEVAQIEAEHGTSIERGDVIQL
jgi:hypothetical protein